MTVDVWAMSRAIQLKRDLASFGIAAEQEEVKPAGQGMDLQEASRDAVVKGDTADEAPPPKRQKLIDRTEKEASVVALLEAAIQAAEAECSKELKAQAGLEERSREAEAVVQRTKKQLAQEEKALEDARSAHVRGEWRASVAQNTLKEAKKRLEDYETAARSFEETLGKLGGE